MAIRGLIFDLDGTVTLTQQFHAQSFAEVFKRHGLNFTAEDDVRYSGRGSQYTFPDFFKEHDIILTTKQVDQYTKEKKELYAELIKNAPMKTVSGVKEFLKKQKSQGIRIAMSTGNSPEATEFLLNSVGLREYFEFIITNRDVANPKPAPDIFLKAAEKLELPAHECVVFEDSVNGVLGAKSAGILCVALKTTTDPQKLLAAGADHLVSTYDEITDDFLDKLLK